MYFLVYFLQVSPPCFLVSSGSCVYLRILASSYPQVHVCLLVSLQHHTFGFMFACWQPHILASTYSKVHVCLLASLHPDILIYSVPLYLVVSLHPYVIFPGLYVFACILASSHLHTHPCILIFSVSCVFLFILASSDLHMLRFVCACLYPCILISSGPQVHVIVYAD